jgi:hypothetical protein
MFAYCGNNPINTLDSNGFATERIAQANNYARDSATVLSVAIALAVVAHQTNKEETAISVKTATSTNQGDYTVYFLHAVDGNNSNIVYVGRVKTANLDARLRYHDTRDRALSYYIPGLTYGQCRAMEQAGMMYHHTINRNDPRYNQIRGISPKNKNRYTYLAEIFDAVNRGTYTDSIYLPVSYWENFMEDEFLNSIP